MSQVETWPPGGDWNKVKEKKSSAQTTGEWVAPDLGEKKEERKTGKGNKRPEGPEKRGCGRIRTTVSRSGGKHVEAHRKRSGTKQASREKVPHARLGPKGRGKKKKKRRYRGGSLDPTVEVASRKPQPDIQRETHNTE